MTAPPIPSRPSTEATADPIGWLALWFASTNVGATFLVGSAAWISEQPCGWIIWIVGFVLVVGSGIGFAFSLVRLRKYRKEEERRRVIEIELLQAEMTFAKFDSEQIIREVDGSLPAREHWLMVATSYGDELRKAALESEIAELKARRERAVEVVAYWDRRADLLSRA